MTSTQAKDLGFGRTKRAGVNRWYTACDECDIYEIGKSLSRQDAIAHTAEHNAKYHARRPKSLDSHSN